MQRVQQLLQRHVTLNILPKSGHETAATTVVFHRMKPRLPSDELQALLASVQGTVISFVLRLIEHCMHSCVLHSMMHMYCVLPCQWSLRRRESNVGQYHVGLMQWPCISSDQPFSNSLRSKAQLHQSCIIQSTHTLDMRLVACRPIRSWSADSGLFAQHCFWAREGHEISWVKQHRSWLLAALLTAVPPCH